MKDGLSGSVLLPRCLGPQKCPTAGMNYLLPPPALFVDPISKRLMASEPRQERGSRLRVFFC